MYKWLSCAQYRDAYTWRRHYRASWWRIKSLIAHGKVIYTISTIQYQKIDVYVQRIKQMLDNFESTDGYGKGYSDSVIDAKWDMRSINIRYIRISVSDISRIVYRLFIRFYRVRHVARSFSAERKRCGSPFAAVANARQLRCSGERSGDTYYYFVGHRRCDLYIEMYFNLNGKQWKSFPRIICSLFHHDHPHLVPISVAFRNARTINLNDFNSTWHYTFICTKCARPINNITINFLWQMIHTITCLMLLMVRILIAHV